MIKITRFNIGKKKHYKGIAIKIGWFKFEIISFKKQKTIRLEWSNWNE